MNISFYNGVSGLVAYQQGMDVISHNIANVNTIGFKGSRTAFDDLLYTQMAINEEGQNLTGHGVKALSTDLINRQGMLLQTQNPLDFALVGDGFFAVEGLNGETEYTRNGAFDISVQGKRGYLVTGDGRYVLSSNGRRIALDRVSGSELFDTSGIGEELGIFTFPNPYGLEPVSSSSFRPTDISGEAERVRRRGREEPPYRIISGALEQSSVDLADEMTNMIVTQRAFQFSAKMVQTADEVEEIVNNLR